ncbi:MAG TPA: substrate-binding domain-containing protein [Acidimicrobiales bacterium]|nr:substrate-binding domain-containing protein [Acidimicrobiales bacterium]
MTTLTAVGAVGAAAGTSAAGAASSSKITIGVDAITEASPNVLQQLAMIRKCAKLLGWKLVVLNANGTTTLMASDMSALVNQNVNGIIDIAITPAVAPQGMAAAKAKGIPIIGEAAPLIDPKHLVAATYAPSDAKMSNMLAKRMIQVMHGKGQALTLADSAIPAIVIRTQTLRKDVKGTQIKVAAVHQVNLSNPVADTQTAVADSVHANQTINIVWALQDFEFSATLQTIKSQDLGNVGVFSYYLDPVDFGLLRADKGTTIPEAVADSPVYDSPWYVFDAFVNKFVLKKKDWITSMSIHPLPYVLVTPQNVQSSGTTYHYPSFQPFFVKRWKSEGVTVHPG